VLEVLLGGAVEEGVVVSGLEGGVVGVEGEATFAAVGEEGGVGAVGDGAFGHKILVVKIISL
jgi:hypothetical protein